LNSSFAVLPGDDPLAPMVSLSVRGHVACPEYSLARFAEWLHTSSGSARYGLSCRP